MSRCTRIACFVVVYVNPIRQREWKWESFFYPSTFVSPVTIILPMLRTHLHGNLSEVQAGERTYESTRQKNIFLFVSKG